MLLYSCFSIFLIVGRWGKILRHLWNTNGDHRHPSFHEQKRKSCKQYHLHDMSVIFTWRHDSSKLNCFNIFLKDLKCELCTVIINLLDTQLEKNATAATVNNTVYSLCALLPADIKASVSARKLGQLVPRSWSWFRLKSKFVHWLNQRILKTLILRFA